MISPSPTTSPSQPVTRLAADLCPGMYVRVAQADLHGESESTEYLLAQIHTVDIARAQADIVLWNEPAAAARHTVGLAQLSRTRIAGNAPFRHRINGKLGHVVTPVTDESQHAANNQCELYFVLAENRVHVVSERELIVTPDWAAPSPVQQLAKLELYAPDRTWMRRDLAVHQARIDASTQGIAELLGARVNLLQHQAEVVQRVLNSTTCRFMLADEVGLGKTIEVGLILQGLRRRDKLTRVLIITPASLTRQWQRELKVKFRLQVAEPASQAKSWTRPAEATDGVLITYEQLLQQDTLRAWVATQPWELLILDEVHNVRRSPALYTFLHDLSAAAARALVLTATPVEARAQEYLELLRLLDPVHYDRVTHQQFAAMVQHLGELRTIIASVERGVREADDFSAQEFDEDMHDVLALLPGDSQLQALVQQVDATAADGGVEAARRALAYVKDNYRIDSRVFRNRRATLEGVELPQRALDLNFTYTPSAAEQAVYDALHDYAEACLAVDPADARRGEALHLLFHAAASSPLALHSVLTLRIQLYRPHASSSPTTTLSPAVRAALSGCPRFPGEDGLLRRLEKVIHNWRHQTQALLDRVTKHHMPPGDHHRLIQVLRAIRERRSTQGKVLIFSSWVPTLELLHQALVRRFGGDAVAEFHRGLHGAQLDSEADWFQNQPACRFLLLDETGGEGRNFQIADTIIHVDLPWTPAALEQRIGRVDRIGRSGTVTSVAPLARDTVEADLFHLWQEGFQLFAHSMSGMEIVLEGIQTNVARAFARDTRSGLRDLLPTMIAQAQELRAAVERERDFDAGYVDWERRREFERFALDYGDGAWLEAPVLQALTDGGYHTDLRRASHILLAAKTNLNLAEAPDFPTERRSGYGEDETGLIRATFHRATAVQYDSIRFFSPGNEWVDKVRTRVLHDDARACAVLRPIRGLPNDALVLALTYRAKLDPRPLLRTGIAPHHLLRVHGYFANVVETLYFSLPGLKRLHPNPAMQEWFKEQKRRDDVDYSQPQRIAQLRRQLPDQERAELIACADTRAQQELAAHAAPTSEVIAQARDELHSSLRGEQAALCWLYGDDEDAEFSRHLDTAAALTQALLDGLAQPLWEPVSATLWILKKR